MLYNVLSRGSTVRFHTHSLYKGNFLLTGVGVSQEVCMMQDQVQ